jgi:toxin ParE1/3/4
MNLPLVFQAGVRDEIDDAYSWYEKRRQGLGEQFLTAVQSVLDRIERNPELHAPIYQNVRHARVKRFP